MIYNLITPKFINKENYESLKNSLIDSTNDEIQAKNNLLSKYFFLHEHTTNIQINDINFNSILINHPLNFKLFTKLDNN